QFSALRARLAVLEKENEIAIEEKVEWQQERACLLHQSAVYRRQFEELQEERKAQEEKLAFERETLRALATEELLPIAADFAEETVDREEPEQNQVSAVEAKNLKTDEDRSLLSPSG
ncbi:unnamed protein product, partial [Amoebophrya sp. A120]